MFKTSLTAAAFALIAGLSHAAQPPAGLAFVATSTPTAEGNLQFEQVSYYCEWVTLYDFYGNWVTVWQCF